MASCIFIRLYAFLPHPGFFCNQIPYGGRLLLSSAKVFFISKEEVIFM